MQGFCARCACKQFVEIMFSNFMSYLNWALTQLFVGCHELLFVLFRMLPHS